MTRQTTSELILRTAGFIFGLISILGGIATWRYSSSREPERYLVSAVVMFLGGIVWMAYSLRAKYQFSKKHISVILISLLLGLTLGLFYTFSACGGECGWAASFCRWEHGYPGRWFITGGCYGPEDTSPNFQLTVNRWRVDGASLLVDIVFWAATGIIVAFLMDVASLKKTKLF